MLGLGQEVGRLAGIEALLALGAEREQALAGLVEATMQVGDEGERLRGEDLLEAGLQGALDGDAGRQGESGVSDMDGPPIRLKPSFRESALCKIRRK